MFTQDSISKELARINKSVPDLLRNNTLIEVDKTPDMKFVAERAMEDESVPEERRKQIKQLYDAPD